MENGITSEHVRTLRGLSQLTREEFAKKVGVSAVLIAKIEYGDRYVTDRTAHKIREAFGLTTRDIAQLSKFGRKYTV